MVHFWGCDCWSCMAEYRRLFDEEQKKEDK